MIACILLLAWVALQSTTAASSTPSTSTSADSGSEYEHAWRVFSHLLAPNVSAVDFFNQHYENSHLFVPRRDDSFYHGGGSALRTPTSDADTATDTDTTTDTSTAAISDLLNLHIDMEQIHNILDASGSAFNLKEDGLTSADIKLVKRVLASDGEWWSAMLPLTALPPTQRVGAQVVEAAMRRGFTLVLNRFSFHSHRLAQLCSALTRHVFGFRIQANLYATPSNSSGFEAHFDWQESMVMQLSGAKRWTLYKQPLIHLPRPDMKFKPRTQNIKNIEQQHIIMRAGSFLYFPSGLIHEATTTAAKHNISSYPSRQQLQAELDDMSRQKVDAHGSEDATMTPLPRSVHVTLGVEIDALFTMHGLLHCFIDELVQRHPSIKQQLHRSIPLSDCPVHSSRTGHSDLRYVDMLHLAIFTVASKNQSLSIPAHLFRKSLWGLHVWRQRDAEIALNDDDVEAIIPPGHLTLAHAILPASLHSDADPKKLVRSRWDALNRVVQRSILFHLTTASSLHQLLHAVTQYAFPLADAVEYVSLIQQRKRGESATLSSTGTTSANPNQHAYEYDSVFEDEYLMRFLHPSFESTHLPALLVDGGIVGKAAADHPKQAGVDAAQSCAASHLNRLSQEINTIWGDILAAMSMHEWDAWESMLLHRRGLSSSASSLSNSDPSLPLHLPSALHTLIHPLTAIRRVFLATSASHLSSQTEYVRRNTQRQSSHRHRMERQRSITLKKEDAPEAQRRQHHKRQNSRQQQHHHHVRDEL